MTNAGDVVSSVDDVECVVQGLVESRTGGLVEVADWFIVEVVDRDGDDVVTELEILVGAVGEGTCGPESTECVIAVNDSALTTEGATVYLPLTFAPA